MRESGPADEVSDEACPLLSVCFVFPSISLSLLPLLHWIFVHSGLHSVEVGHAYAARTVPIYI